MNGHVCVIFTKSLRLAMQMEIMSSSVSRWSATLLALSLSVRKIERKKTFHFFFFFSFIIKDEPVLYTEHVKALTMKMFSVNRNIALVIIILPATNLTNKMEFNQSLRIMTVIMKIMNKKVIMTSLSVFRPSFFFLHISMVI